MAYRASIPYCTDAAAYYTAIADLPWAIWLDSGGRGHYDILCAQPVVTLLTYQATTTITRDTSTQHSAADPFDLLRQQLGTPVAPLPGIPFAGGALGYWGYDLARRLMTLPAQAQNAEQLPDMAVGIYDWAIVVDHQQQTAYLVSQLREAATVQVLPQILARLQGRGNVPRPAFAVHGLMQSNLSRTAYQFAFDEVQTYLRAGDCYQVNLAQRYTVPASGDALQAYLELRRISPAPYAAFLNLPQAQILCASPECFLQVQAGSVQTRPIKGTRPRLADLQQDIQIAHELQHSAKD
ncbi:MAG: chorismate-binding protein, partial [Gallionellaceae bacterium]|nr:chorismate-binding protein [Gallionellaceae bacterium]